MNRIVISIRPQWVADILNRHKRIEIRKTMPRCKLPAEVYVYVTKEKPELYKFGWGRNTYWYETFNSLDDICLDQCHALASDVINGKIVAKFTLNKVENIGRKYANQHKDSHFYDILKASCLTTEDLENYSYIPLEKRKSDFPDLYAWHIENLEIFDKPKKLSELGLKRAPQSWCYAKETEND